ncbi:MAG: TIR domain-containing protein [Gemmatimonadales bacterium]|nr:TIR domain-containing protein [Gemmatimonadales bacterium]
MFKTSGIPTHTFVRPLEYAALQVALRTPGRGVVVEGPSGIGKTTSVARALEELGIGGSVTRLSARRRDDLPLIQALNGIRAFGTVLVDDFHRLDEPVRRDLADLMKLLADEETPDCKLILIGINSAGQSLVRFAHDLNNRIEIISLETNPDEKVDELLQLGEGALNIGLNVRDEIVAAAHGSFYIAQMLAHQSCLDAGILEAPVTRTDTAVSFEATRGKVFDRLSRTFMERTKRFARGSRFRREGRAPYLRLLHFLASAEEWSLSLDDVMTANPGLSGSISQLVEKGYLRDAINGDAEFAAVLHFDSASRQLSVEDPQYVYFLRCISWSRFPLEVGYLSVEIPSKYDFALSFAGVDRAVAATLFELLTEMEFAVFYDKNEQHRILAEDVEDYLRPIYQSDADLIVALLGPEYPKRIWTKFESDQFKARFGDGAVIPVWFANAPPGLFDESTRVGGCTFDPNAEQYRQLSEIADLLRRKIGDLRTRADTAAG